MIAGLGNEGHPRDTASHARASNEQPHQGIVFHVFGSVSQLIQPSRATGRFDSQAVYVVLYQVSSPTPQSMDEAMFIRIELVGENI